MTINTTGRHTSTVHIARFFDFDHLTRDDLRGISQMCAILAEEVIDQVEDGPELTAGLRKLLEAKDCFVRAAL